MEPSATKTTPLTSTTTDMADDTRNLAIKEDLSREALTVDPTQKAFTGTQWQDGKAQGYKPPQNANLMPGGTENTAGGQTKEIGVGDALESIKLEEFTEIHKKPCVRDALMTGIGSGFGIGGVRALIGGMLLLIESIGNCVLTSFCSESMDLLQLGRRRMGGRLGRNVPVLPVQTSDGKGGHDKGNGDLEQEGYGKESTGGKTREDSRRKTEEQRPGARCADRGSRRGKAEPGWEVLVEGVVIGSLDRYRYY